MPIDIVYTFPGNPRSEKIVGELIAVRQRTRLNEETRYMVLTRDTPLFEQIRSGQLLVVALVDSNLLGGKHLRFVPGRSQHTNGLPDWATTAQYVGKVGSSCCDAKRYAELLHAIFVRKFAERLTKFPLPWGAAKDSEAARRRSQRKRDKRTVKHPANVSPSLFP